MGSYFKHFPKVEYDGKSIVNISRRVKILDKLKNNPLAYLAYNIKDNDRPEDIAYYYYDDPHKVWLVYLANNIIDPYSQWPLSEEDFREMFKQKYKDLSKTSGNDIIRWGMNTTITNNIVHYENVNDSTIKINKDTYLYGNIEASDWRAIRYYDYESNLNEQKRFIFLVDRKYADQIQKELESILNDK